MRRSICVLLVVGAALAASGQEPGGNIVLTPKAAAEGWLALFDGETTYGWTASAGEKLIVRDGVLLLKGGGSIQTTTAFHEYALQFKCRITGAQAHDAVQIGFGGLKAKIAMPNQKVSPWNDGKLMVAGKRYKLSLSSESSAFPVVEGEMPEQKPACVAFTVTDGVELELREVSLMPLGLKPIFNGKTLEGWKEFVGDKYVSKFAVNDKLEFNVRNGPGDLQTLGKYADFLLQLECISNGKHLNSGIFFRCMADKYQDGYECQIRNQFTAEAKQKYVIEHHDPQTHQVTKKETILLPAVDYGTGAIYRRMPARKQMSKDGEWFTLTIAAHDNHFGTWVNGVQVCDWTDHRAANNNPRNGCRLDAGHISIQGHDPTTDLSFRNVRIADYLKVGIDN